MYEVESNPIFLDKTEKFLRALFKCKHSSKI